MSPRTMTKMLVGVSLTALGSLLLLELSVRIYLFGLAGLHIGKVDSVQTIWETGFLSASTERKLGYEFKPNVDGYFKLARFRTNSRGLRDREYSLEKPPDTFRVAVLGASYALPSGVEIEDAFHSVLEERLTAESSSRAYEFINFAVGAYGPRQLLAMLQLRALAYDPDLVLFIATRLSMPVLRSAWDKPLPYPRSLERRHAFHEVFLIKLLEVRLGRTSVDFSPRFPPRRPDGVLDVVEKLGEMSRTTGVPVVVVRLEYEARAPSPLERATEREIRAQGLYFVDTRDAFAGTNPRDFWIYELDPHPDARAHAIFAEVIAAFMRENGLMEP